VVTGSETVAITCPVDALIATIETSGLVEVASAASAARWMVGSMLVTTDFALVPGKVASGTIGVPTELSIAICVVGVPASVFS
jgi:hypothetical protein